MATLEVTLSAELARFVEEQARHSGISTGAYIVTLVHQEWKQCTREALEKELLKGLDSGPPSEMTQDDWSRIRAELLARHQRREVQ